MGPHSPGNNDKVAGSDPILVAQVVMLENANKVLEASIISLHSDMQKKMLPSFIVLPCWRRRNG